MMKTYCDSRIQFLRTVHYPHCKIVCALLEVSTAILVKTIFRAAARSTIACGRVVQSRALLWWNPVCVDADMESLCYLGCECHWVTALWHASGCGCCSHNLTHPFMVSDTCAVCSVYRSCTGMHNGIHTQSIHTLTYGNRKHSWAFFENMRCLLKHLKSKKIQEG